MISLYFRAGYRLRDIVSAAGCPLCELPDLRQLMEGLSEKLLRIIVATNTDCYKQKAKFKMLGTRFVFRVSIEM